MKNKIRIGCSGWSYMGDSGWVSNFYPKGIPPNKMFQFYSKIFDTVEINTTFYNLPKVGIVENWAKQAPQNFLFSVKFPQDITHKKIGKEPINEEDLMAFFYVIAPLEQKMGPILVQFPPSFKFNPELLEELLVLLPSRDKKYAIEFRDLSWLISKTSNLLEQYHVAYCIVDEPLLPPDIIITTDFAYIRWHGRRKQHWYNYLYSENELKEWVPKIEKISNEVKEIYGYFNNHPHGQAPTNCRQLLELLGRKTVDPKTVTVKSLSLSKDQKKLDSFFR
ncbi:MAG: DUF72 domain-containing protein [Candidatus Helarchaeota archaeon]